VSRAAGLTLVEVMVAMTLVLVVVAGSVTFLTRGRAVHRSGESIARLEESLDAGFSLLVDEIRLSGYLGLAPPRSAVDGMSALGTPERADLAVAGGCGASLAHDLAAPLVAVDAAYGAATGIALRCRPSPEGRAMAGTDTLILRHAAPEPAPAQSGRLQLESNLRAAVLSADGTPMLGAEARRHDLEVGVYYVSRDSTGRRDWPSLRRKRLVGGTRPAFQDEELVSGIADLQIQLGVDDATDADDAVDRWIRPGEAMAGAMLRALRIELEAVSDVPERDQPDFTRRKRVSRVVELRNAGSPS
jgi:type IV pilus assembly protein PilW